jgi:hypothetical protein
MGMSAACETEKTKIRLYGKGKDYYKPGDC